MHRNTFILLIVLAISAAVIVAVNIFSPPRQDIPTPQPSPEPTAVPQITFLTYKSEECGISFDYPSTFTKLDNPAGGALLSGGTDSTETIAVTCQEEIPRPPVTQELMEEVVIGSVSATLYHDASANDGTPIDKLIFPHPSRRVDVYLAGIGETFSEIIRSLKLL